MGQRKELDKEIEKEGEITTYNHNQGQIVSQDYQNLEENIIIFKIELDYLLQF